MFMFVLTYSAPAYGSFYRLGDPSIHRTALADGQGKRAVDFTAGQETAQHSCIPVHSNTQAVVADPVPLEIR